MKTNALPVAKEFKFIGKIERKVKLTLRRKCAVKTEVSANENAG
jgi:hypothetical protein